MTRSRPPRCQLGFNLIEVAISLAVLAIVAAGMLVPLVTQIEQRNFLTTASTIADLKDALLGFATINGRLPCPATAAAGTGVEVFAVGVGNSAANGECAAFWGFVPGQTLGITPVDRNGYVIDAWNNRIRYAVLSTPLGSPAITRPYTRTNGLRTASLAAIQTALTAVPPVFLQVCGSGTGVIAGSSCSNPAVLGGGPNALTANAVVVLWSPGPNAITTGGNGTDEAQNPNPRNEASTDALFVTRTRSDDPNNPFDDVVSWLSINTLINRMVGAGQLP